MHTKLLPSKPPALLWPALLMVGLVLVVLSFYEANRAQREIVASNALLAQVERKPVPIDTGVYAQYAGRYQLEPDFYINITTFDQRLYAQGSNQVRVEIFPLDESTYFNEFTEALITFVVSAEGRSERIVVRQINKVRQGVRS
ncbi:MAG: hypothetical protein AAF529_17120 [Pseudomonadota bacterium]